MKKTKKLRVLFAPVFVVFSSLIFSGYIIITDFLEPSKTKNTIAMANPKESCFSDEGSKIQKPINENVTLFISCGGFLE